MHPISGVESRGAGPEEPAAQSWLKVLREGATGLALRLSAAIVATVAGVATTLSSAALTTVPALFLGAGVVTGVLVWLGVRRLVDRRRVLGRPGRRPVVGVMAAGVALTAVLVPLGDPVRSPAAPPDAGMWTMPDGGRLAYGVVGARQGMAPAMPVVVLHGGPGVPDLAGQLAALRPLADDGHDVWAYAQRGSGGSSRLANPAGYTVDQALRDLEQVRQRIGADRIILLGHSYGAFLAASYVARYPERVARLVLSSPGDLDQEGLGGVPQSRLDAGQRWQVSRLLPVPHPSRPHRLPRRGGPSAPIRDQFSVLILCKLLLSTAVRPPFPTACLVPSHA